MASYNLGGGAIILHMPLLALFGPKKIKKEKREKNERARKSTHYNITMHK